MPLEVKYTLSLLVSPLGYPAKFTFFLATSGRHRQTRLPGMAKLKFVQLLLEKADYPFLLGLLHLNMSIFFFMILKHEI